MYIQSKYASGDNFCLWRRINVCDEDFGDMVGVAWRMYELICWRREAGNPLI